MPIQTIVITDARGRTATIQIYMNHRGQSYMEHLPTSGYPQARHLSGGWHAETLGALGAQNGGIQPVHGSASREFARADDLILTAQWRRGMEENLVILKRWHTSRGFSLSGTGTLLHGVNLGLQSGEIAWSRLDNCHRR